MHYVRKMLRAALSPGLRSNRNRTTRPALESLEDRSCPSVTIHGPTLLRPGDAVSITAYLSTTDLDEGGEGEPLIVTVGGDTVINVKYPFETWRGNLGRIGELLQIKGNAQIAAYIKGEDGDEVGTVDVEPYDDVILYPLVPPDEVDSFNQLGAAFNQDADRWALASAAASGTATSGPFLSNLTGGNGTGTASFAGNTAGAALAAAFFGAEAAQSWEISAAYQLLGPGTPDPNFTTVAQPVVQPLQIGLQPANATLAPQVAAFQAQLASLATELGVLRALDTAFNRATGAANAHDQASFAMQRQAISGFKAQLASILAAEPALLARAESAAASLGVSLSSTSSDALSFESNALSKGLPKPIVNVLQLTGAASADIANFAKVASGQDTSAIAGNHITQLTDPSTVSLMQKSVTVLHTDVSRVTTPGVFDPATATWYLRSSNSAGAPDAGRFQYGAPGWVPIVGDWDGNGTMTIGAFDPATATWYLRNENSPGAPDAGHFRFGAPGWIPVVGDWTGSGHTGIGMFDPATATFYLRNEAGPGAPDAGKFAYGAPTWIPIVGDWTGSGHTGIGVFDPGTATFYLRNEAGPGAPDAGRFAYGAPGWIPLAGDWSVSGHAGIGVFDPGTATFYLRNETSAGAPDAGRFAYGAPGWVPVGGNFQAAPPPGRQSSPADASLLPADLLLRGKAYTDALDQAFAATA